MKKLTEEERLVIITECVAWFTPKELREMFGIQYSHINNTCNKYGITKYTASMTNLKKEHEDALNELICERREQALENVYEKTGLK